MGKKAIKKVPKPVTALRKVMPRGSGQLTSPQKVAMLERRYKVMEMRRQGFSYEDIGKALGCDPQTASGDMRSILSMTASTLMESTDEARQLEIDRLDSMLKRFQPLAEAGNMAAANIAMQIGRERRKMMALDKPEAKGATETGVRIYVGVDISDV